MKKKKKKKKQLKNCDFCFFISAPSVDCGCSLEPPLRALAGCVWGGDGKNIAHTCEPQYLLYKRGGGHSGPHCMSLLTWSCVR